MRWQNPHSSGGSRLGWLRAGILALALALAGCGPASQAHERTPTDVPTAQLAPTATAQPTASPTAPPTAQPSVVAVTPTPGAAVAAAPAGSTSISGDEALATARWLSETIGSRPTGADGERAAAAGLAERLRALGYDVSLQSFPVTRFEDRGSTLAVDELGVLQLSAIVNSAAAQVRGPLVDAGLGRADELRGRDLRGTIAVIRRGEITFAEKARNAAAAGALGAVIVNREPGLFAGMMEDPAPIPVAALGGAEGDDLLARLAAGPLSAELHVDASITESSSQNVVARLPGAAEETVVLGAHYDSVAEGPGANDNASGVAVVLELAEAAPTLGLPYSLEVVLFGAEEIGLVGSRHYIAQLAPAERERIAAMVNLDMVGVGDRLLVGGDGELVDAALDAAAERGVALAAMPGESDRSDHAAFAAAGVPVVFLHRPDDPRYHTAHDVVDHLTAERLQVVGDMTAVLLQTVLATAAP